MSGHTTVTLGHHIQDLVSQRNALSKALERALKALGPDHPAIPGVLGTTPEAEIWEADAIKKARGE